MRQPVVGFHQLETRRLLHALTRQEGLARAAENDDAVAGAGKLQQVCADQDVAAIQCGQKIGARLVIAAADL